MTLYTPSAVTAWSMDTTTMPWAMASSSTGLSASRSVGLTMMASTPWEMSPWMSAICSGVPALRLARTTSSTTPDAAAWAWMAQTICSRQALPTSVLLTPMV